MGIPLLFSTTGLTPHLQTTKHRIVVAWEILDVAQSSAQQCSNQVRNLGFEFRISFS
jgi:hypothetical protein